LAVLLNVERLIPLFSNQVKDDRNVCFVAKFYMTLFRGLMILNP